MNLEDFGRGSITLWPCFQTPDTKGGVSPFAFAAAKAKKRMVMRRVAQVVKITVDKISHRRQRGKSRPDVFAVVHDHVLEFHGRARGVDNPDAIAGGPGGIVPIGKKQMAAGRAWSDNRVL